MTDSHRWLLPLLAVVSGGFYLGAETYSLDGGLGFPLDDSWIHLQFARNLAAGDGLSLNPGEWVTGSTAPLWTALLAIFFLFPGSPLLWSKLLGWSFYGLSVLLTRRVALQLGLGPGLALLAATLVALTDWMLWSAVSGLEIPLFVTLSLWGTSIHLRERSRGDGEVVSLAVLALACLARPEGQLLLLLALLDRSVRFDRNDPSGSLGIGWREPRAALVGAGLALVVLGPMLLFNVLVSGSVAPTTFAAKVGSSQAAGAGSFLPGLRYLFQAPIAILFASQPIMTLSAAAGGFALVRRLGTDRDRGLLPVAWCVALPLAYGSLSVLGGSTIAGNFGRYFFPLVPFVVILGCLGIEGAAKALGRSLRVGAVRLPLRALLVLLILWPTLAGGVRGVRRYTQSVGNVHDSDVRAAHWLRDRIPPDAVLAVNDIGALSYLLPNRVLDLAGIAHPSSRRYRVEAVAAGRPAAEGTLRFLEENRPDYLVIFPEWFPSLVARAERDPASRFRILERFPIPDNITMGGSEVVVLSTPWARGAAQVETGPAAEGPDGGL